MLFEILAKQQRQFTSFDVAAGLEFAVDQVAVYFQFKTPAITGDERERLDLVFVGGQNFFRRTDGTGEVVSNSAVGEGDVNHAMLLESQVNTTQSIARDAVVAGTCK